MTVQHAGPACEMRRCCSCVRPPARRGGQRCTAAAAQCKQIGARCTTGLAVQECSGAARDLTSFQQRQLQCQQTTSCDKLACVCACPSQRFDALASCLHACLSKCSGYCVAVWQRAHDAALCKQGFALRVDVQLGHRASRAKHHFCNNRMPAQDAPNLQSGPLPLCVTNTVCAGRNV